MRTPQDPPPPPPPPPPKKKKINKGKKTTLVPDTTDHRFRYITVNYKAVGYLKIRGGGTEREKIKTILLALNHLLELN